MSQLPEEERVDTIVRQQMRERAETIVREQKREHLTLREPWLKLGADGRLLVRIALFCAIIFFLGFCTFRTLIGGNTISWN